MAGLLNVTWRLAAAEQGVAGQNGFVPAVLAGYDLGLDGAKRYLNQELGIKLEQTKNQSLAQAISKPADFMTARALAISGASDTAADAFKTHIQKLLDTGVPYETARHTATLYAKQIYDAEMSIYDMAHPGYATAIGSDVAKRELKEEVRDLYLQDRKAYKKKIKRKVKAKQAAKRAAQSAS